MLVPLSSHVSFISFGYEWHDIDIPEGIGARSVSAWSNVLGGGLCFPFSYGTAKSGVGISAMSVLRPDLMMKCVIPVIMAGIIAVRRFSLFSVSTRPYQNTLDLRSRRLCVDLWKP